MDTKIESLSLFCRLVFIFQNAQDVAITAVVTVAMLHNLDNLHIVAGGRLRFQSLDTSV